MVLLGFGNFRRHRNKKKTNWKLDMEEISRTVNINNELNEI